MINDDKWDDKIYKPFLVLYYLRLRQRFLIPPICGKSGGWDGPIASFYFLGLSLE